MVLSKTPYFEMFESINIGVLETVICYFRLGTTCVAGNKVRQSTKTALRKLRLRKSVK